MSATVAVLFSGGLDSAIAIAHLLSDGRRVQPLYVDCGLHWQPIELLWARRFLSAIRSPNLRDAVVLSLPLADVYGDHWSISGQHIPRADEPDERVYLPGRNPLLLVKSHLWCHLNGVPQLALGALQTNPFADASDEFFMQFSQAMNRAISGHVEIIRPFARMTKRDVMHLGRHAPLQLTFTCINPQGEQHCGLCNKCHERQQAFATAGMADPTEYAGKGR